MRLLRPLMPGVRATMKQIAIFLIFLFTLNGVLANDVEYRPGGVDFENIWDRFYAGDHEPELDDPLIEAGPKMTLVICEAVANKDMRLRRYAIGALGFVGDSRALATLERILEDTNEKFYFRGDALHAIYQINRELG